MNRCSRRFLQAAVGALVAAASLACTPHPLPREVQLAARANPELVLHLVTAPDWQLFEVRADTLARRFELLAEGSHDSPPSSPPIVVTWSGDATRWFDSATSWIPSPLYARHRHSGEIQFRNPWDGAEWIIEARAWTRRVLSVSLPVGREFSPHFMFLRAPGEMRTNDDPVGGLAFDGASRRLFFGQLAGREIEIERVGVQSWDVDPGVVQHLTAPFPEAGQFVIRIDGFETSRFLLRPRRRPHTSYRLAVRHSASPVDRSLTLGVFLAFDHMRDFILGTLSY